MKISIITINYNNLAGLIKTVNSVINQTIKNFEFIIIDGGSTDGSKEYIQQMNEFIDYWVSEPDNGIYHAMNKGIEVAKGEYCLFLNSGDYFLENTSLSILVKSSIGYDIIYGDIIFEGTNKVYRASSKLDFNYFLSDTIPHASALIKRELFKKFGLYNQKLTIVADWEFFIKCVILYNVSYFHVDKIMTVYQIGGISLNTAYRDIHKLERTEVLNKYFATYMSLINENENLKLITRLYFKVNIFKGILKLIYFKITNKHYHFNAYNNIS
jgi:glycosyltransferase involved in cell wall biosynthesis